MIVGLYSYLRVRDTHTHKLCVLVWGLLTKSASNQQELMADSQMAIICKSFLWDCPASTETSPLICLYQGAGREEGEGTAGQDRRCKGTEVSAQRWHSAHHPVSTP